MNIDTIPVLYEIFQAPLSRIDCGNRCAPFNDKKQPFCCDTRYVVPVAYRAEWAFLQEQSKMWVPYERQAENNYFADLEKDVARDQVLISCSGHLHCERQYRTICCRAFPFYPYINSNNEFIGLAYYWEYENLCWVISNLHMITKEYRDEFISVFDMIFDKIPQEKVDYYHYSSVHRSEYSKNRKKITLIHREGGNDISFFRISPKTEWLESIELAKLPAFYPYDIAHQLIFTNEET
jgi:hypothetical protein